MKSLPIRPPSVQAFPPGAQDAPHEPWSKIPGKGDWLTQQDWWMGEEDRLGPWLWLKILNWYMDLPEDTSWIDHLLFYKAPGSNELRPIPKYFSWQALLELKREAMNKPQNDPRREILEHIYIPHIEHKRTELGWMVEER